jgi:hypothetical protein
MSVPFEIIECDRCEYVQTTLVTAGKFVWTNGHDEYWFDRDLALCDDCEAVVAIERFPAKHIFEMAKQRRASFWRRLTKKYGDGEVGKIAASESFTVLEAVMALRRAPVCLECGGTHIRPLVRPGGSDTANTTARSLHAVHPGCGGGLTIRGSGGERVAPLEITRVYDIYGRKVSQRPGWH